MDSNQILNIMDKYFNTIEVFGDLSRNELDTLLYFMFIDECYEVKRDLYLKDATNPYALNDCVVKMLNNTISVLKGMSEIACNEPLYDLPNMRHWVLPDITPPNE